MAVNRWQAASDLLGHKIENKSTRHGKVAHHWVVCSCGYESSPGKSVRFAISAGIGHAQRVAAELRRAGTLITPDTPKEVAERSLTRARPGL